MEWLEWLLAALIVQICWASAIAYLPLQVYTGLKWRGAWRISALVPLLLMIPVFGLTAYALAEESNLWPILWIFTSPVGTGYLLVLFLIRRLVTPPEVSRTSIAGSNGSAVVRAGPGRTSGST